MAQKIVIVGGGAGGLELATKLGNKYKNNASVDILLLDKYPFHIWKPLYHEVATGSLDVDMDGVDFRAHGANNHFEFQLGELKALDRTAKTITLEPINSNTGEQLVPERAIEYDYLVVAIGSITNDFGTPGVKEHCLTLDTTGQAEKFHQKILNEFLKIKVAKENHPLKIAIVGAGATGVELAAELFKVTDLLKVYGFNNVNRHSIEVSIIEASDRILGALPERISDSATKILTQLGVELKTSTKVQEVLEKGLLIDTGETLKADITVWCAGVKGAPVLKNLGGLNTNRINQIEVNPYLQATEDESIFALGDCASCKQENGQFVPPRAQSAHQMATTVSQNIQNLISGKPLVKFEYKDKGSLVSFADYSSVGFLSSMTNKKVFVEGSIARYLYVSLYRLHQAALHGYFKMMLLAVVGRINRRLRPLLKLH